MATVSYGYIFIRTFQSKCIYYIIYSMVVRTLSDLSDPWPWFWMFLRCVADLAFCLSCYATGNILNLGWSDIR